MYKSDIDYLIDMYVDNGNNFYFEFDQRNPVVRLHEPSYGSEEIKAAVEVMLSTNITLGKSGHVAKFERQFAIKYGFKHAVMVNSGSSANLLATSVLTSHCVRKLKPGDKVIVPALCWSTSIWPLIQNGLIPVIVDICPYTLNIDFNRVGKDTFEQAKGILVVHVYGNPCNVYQLKRVCAKYDLVLIEDCCEALGSLYDGGVSVGSLGIISTFSFYFSHHMTTFEGGMCVTNDETLHNRLKIMRSHGWSREVEEHIEHPGIDPKFTFVDLGYNFRPTEIQGAIGLEQLKKVDNFIKIRNENYLYWIDELNKYSEVLHIIHQEDIRYFNSSFGFTCVTSDKANFTVKEIREHMEINGIETRPIICGNISRQPAIRSHSHIFRPCPVADNVMRNGFAWGNHQHICNDARKYVVDVIDQFMKSKGY